MAEEEGAAYSPLQAVVVEPVSAHIQPAAVAALCSGSIMVCNVVCEGFSWTFHAETVCLGVDVALIAALLNGEDTVNFKRYMCRGGATTTQEAQGNDFGIVYQVLT